MIIVNITDKDFEKGYTPKGNLNGAFAEAQEYLGWVLDSRNTDNVEHFKEALKTFSERWNMPGLTTKYLRGIMETSRENKNQRIRYLLTKSGLTIIPTKNYVRQMVCIKGNIKRFIYTTLPDGKTTISDEKVETISRLARVFSAETLHKIVKKEEVEKTERKLAMEKLKLSLLDNVKEYEKTFFGNFVGDEHRQNKAIAKLKIRQEGFIPLNCKECKHQIRIPLCPNIETNETERFVSGIYGAVIQDVQEGIYLCPKCRKTMEQDDNWRKSQIVGFLKDLLDNSKEKINFIGFNHNEFCKDFRVDGREMAVGWVRDVIKDIVSSNNLDKNIEVISKKQDICLKIIKPEIG